MGGVSKHLRNSHAPFVTCITAGLRYDTVQQNQAGGRGAFYTTITITEHLNCTINNIAVVDCSLSLSLSLHDTSKKKKSAVISACFNGCWPRFVLAHKKHGQHHPHLFCLSLLHFLRDIKRQALAPRADTLFPILARVVDSIYSSTRPGQAMGALPFKTDTVALRCGTGPLLPAGGSAVRGSDY